MGTKTFKTFKKKLVTAAGKIGVPGAPVDRKGIKRLLLNAVGVIASFEAANENANKLKQCKGPTECLNLTANQLEMSGGYYPMRNWELARWLRYAAEIIAKEESDNQEET